VDDATPERIEYLEERVDILKMLLAAVNEHHCKQPVSWRRDQASRKRRPGRGRR